MLEIKIKGANIQELYLNAANMLLLLSRGGQNMPMPSTPASTGQEAVGEAVPEDNPPVTPETKPKRKPRTPPVTIEATADPLGLDDKPVDATPAAELTLDDMRSRVKAIIAAHGPKTPETPDGRGNSMQDCIAYVRKLFVPFGVKLAAELKPEQFAPFMAQSLAYLNGTAK